LIAHGLNTGAAHADASADRIDAAVMGENGDLGAHARITRRAFQLKQTLLDLRHFIFEELGDEHRRRAGQDDLLATRLAVNVFQVSANAITNAQVFFRNHFGTRKAGLDLADFNNGVALVHALDRARDDGFAALQEV